MDVDFLNLSPEAQMDLMNLIYMEKLAEFSETTTPSSSDALAPGSSQALYTTPAAPHSPVLLFGASPPLLCVPPHAELSSVAAMREVIFRIAAMQPVHIDPESVKPPKRRNVRISKDPQSVAARHRRERISEKIRILQRLVPGGTKMDTASMLDEAIHYVKFLKTQVQSLEKVASAAANRPADAAAAAAAGLGLGLGFSCYSTSLDGQGFPVQMLR